MGARMSGPHILLANVFFAPFTYGGATVVAEEVARALIRGHGMRVTAVSVCRRADLVPYGLIRSEVAGITSYLINLPPQVSYAEIYNNPRVTEIVARLMDQMKPDLLHAHCVQDMGAGFLQAARARGLPVILSVHDFWWLCERQFMIRADQRYCGQNPVDVAHCRGCAQEMSAARTRQGFLFEQAAQADIITYPSHFARDLSEASGLAPGRGVVWPNGVTLPGEGFSATQAARRVSDPRIAFGFLGGPSQIKGWPLIRRTFTGFGRSDFRGYLVDGSLDGSWWRGHDLTGLDGDWQVYPRFDQAGMDAFYARIDVLLFTSQWKETYGLAIREALARGIQVIQTDSGGTTEHAAVRPETLIPIGAGPEALRPQIVAALMRDPAQFPAHRVCGFGDQAAELARMIGALTGQGAPASAPNFPVAPLRRRCSAPVPAGPGQAPRP